MKTKALMIALILIWCSSMWNPQVAQERNYIISGSVRYVGNGDITIFLVDEEMFSQPLIGLQTVVLKTGSASNKPMIQSFQLMTVKAGTYGVRCFQDTNGNGKFDRGLFGPKEPWGMSWNADKPAKWPRFSNISFQVNADTELITINVD